MPVFAINYTLSKKQPKDYANLAGAIKGASNGNYLRCLDSFWMICSDAAITDVYNHLAKFISPGDLLMVHEMTRNYVCYLKKTERDWIKKVLG
jgi:hypothetical protein